MARETFHGNVMDASEVVSGLYKFQIATHKLVLVYMEQEADLITQYMKENAPWEDRTHTARDSLVAHSDADNVAGGMTEIRMTLESPAHNDRGQEYGNFLEDGTSHARPYPILEPTMRLRVPFALTGMKLLLNQMGPNWLNPKK